MKRSISILLLVVMTFSLVACSSNHGSNTNQTNLAENSKTDENTKTPSQSNQTKPTEVPAKKETPKFEPIVVMDLEGIKVTLTAFAQTTDTDYGYLRFLVENNSTNDICVQSRDVVINGYMHDPIMSIEVAAGKKAIDEMKFDATQLLMCGIRVIGSIQFYLHCFSQDFTPIVDSDVITYTTPDQSNASPAYQPTGGIVYEENGIQIIADGITAPSEYGQYAYFHIANESGKNMIIQARNVSINGFMVDPIFSVEVVSGAKAVDYMRIPEEELLKNGIERAESFELQFHVFNDADWGDSFNSDPISFGYTYKQ